MNDNPPHFELVSAAIHSLVEARKALSRTPDKAVMPDVMQGQCPYCGLVEVEYMHEDELPANLTDEQYAEWFAKSLIPGGVGCRVGPVVAHTLRDMQANNYARALAVSLHGKHFAEVTQWEPLPDTLGLLTQIDNMVSGLERRSDEHA